MQLCRKPVRTCQLICSLLGQKSNDDDHVVDMGLGMLSMHTKNDSKSVLKDRDTHTMGPIAPDPSFVDGFASADVNYIT